MKDVNTLRKGVTFEADGNLLKVLEYHHHKPGRGKATIRIKTVNLRSGAITESTFQSGDRVQDVQLDYHKVQYLYNDGEYYHFMNEADYSQIQLTEGALDRPDLMKEGEIVTIQINSEDNMPLSVDMPASVILEVTHTEPGVKGNTATNATKPATVETGATVNVPLFINEGDKIKIETEKGTYKERIKE